ncbi:hypothetical protein HG530_014533 [Fusarium avenaceum]|nr:hypothetical protein HG530_014533 [Fusarium avenaceum]
MAGIQQRELLENYEHCLFKWRIPVRRNILKGGDLHKHVENGQEQDHEVTLPIIGPNHIVIVLIGRLLKFSLSLLLCSSGLRQLLLKLSQVLVRLGLGCLFLLLCHKSEFALVHTFELLGTSTDFEDFVPEAFTLENKLAHHCFDRLVLCRETNLGLAQFLLHLGALLIENIHGLACQLSVVDARLNGVEKILVVGGESVGCVGTAIDEFEVLVLLNSRDKRDDR